MTQHIMTGFGFGPIQSGIFAYEAFRSGAFDRIVIAEVDEALVAAVNGNGGAFEINVAGRDGIERVRVEGVEMLHPARDRAKLVEALKASTEIVTALPSVAFFTRGADSVADLIAEGLQDSTAPATIIYTAENNNHAAEILADAVRNCLGMEHGTASPGEQGTASPGGTAESSPPFQGWVVEPNDIRSPGGTTELHVTTQSGRLLDVQFLNTVIGKMSQVVADPALIREKGLAPLAPGFGRAHLVEAFNRILVTRCTIDGFRPGIACFDEKKDLLPFEEAKLFGHNAIHALMGFLGARKGYASMADLARDTEIMRVARAAFLEESGAALIRKYAWLGDALFTKEGYYAYAEDLLERITNPYLDDSVERAVRDPLRKLAPGDRIFGTMALALEQGIEPRNLALGAAAGMELLLHDDNIFMASEVARQADWNDVAWIDRMLEWIWGVQAVAFQKEIVKLLQGAKLMLKLARPADTRPRIIQFVDLLLKRALHDKADEVRIDVQGDGLTVHFLINGHWVEIPNPPAKWKLEIMDRIQVLAQSKDCEIPHDGETLPLRLEIISSSDTFSDKETMRLRVMFRR